MRGKFGGSSKVTPPSAVLSALSSAQPPAAQVRTGASDVARTLGGAVRAHVVLPEDSSPIGSTCAPLVDLSSAQV